ncbi:hypothetical protein EVAR_26709_1 [Eumeta japonica]|uniref:Uncharacterized protein n=1 Tax=Eumeta variegata TaxID=151549 RepID=A0A4C1ZUN7_EUMVA|nr:hypothetical protein EVAR_26709_1 [Eumeta japonica]
MSPDELAARGNSHGPRLAMPRACSGVWKRPLVKAKSRLYGLDYSDRSSPSPAAPWTRANCVGRPHAAGH